MRIAVKALLVAKFIIQSYCDMRSFYLVASAFLNFLIFAHSRHLIFRLEFRVRQLNLHLISTAARDLRLKYAKFIFKAAKEPVSNRLQCSSKTASRSRLSLAAIIKL